MRFLLLFFLLGTLALRAAAPSPEFVGIATSDGVTRLAFRDPASGTSQWVKVGDGFGDYILAAYDTTNQTAELAHGSDRLHLKLTAAKVAPPSEPVSPPEEYIVQAGDTAAKIARSHNISLTQLMTINPGVNWRKLYVSQKLRLRP